MRLLLAAAVVPCLLCISCGYVGDPLPPALNIASPVEDLAVVEFGDQLVIDFTIPPLTTEGLTLTKLGTVELRIGATVAPFEIGKWASGAKVYPLDAAKTGPVHGQVPAAEWVGKEVAIAVRVINPKGRASSWSNLVSMHVLPPLAVPTDVQVASDAKGARVYWQSPERSFRVFRKGPADKEPLLAGTSDRPEFIDSTAQFGTQYEYSVQAVHDRAESRRSAPVTFTPKDEFAPAIPAGLTVVPGIGTIELVWDRNTEPDLRGYRVYRSVDGGAEERIADLVEAPAYSDRAVQSGKKYRYTITAVDQTGNESKPSAAVEATAP